VSGLLSLATHPPLTLKISGSLRSMSQNLKPALKRREIIMEKSNPLYARIEFWR
jgi:hypothetical protein